MADPVAITGDGIAKLAKSVQKLQHSHDPLGIPQLYDNTKKAAVVLETSRQKFTVWRKTWMENVSDPDKVAEGLWGSAGWSDIKKLLGAIQDASKKMHMGIERMDDGSSSPKWKHVMWFPSKKKDQTVTVKSPTLLELAIQLSRSVDELWTYSEVEFDSLHGIFAQKIDPPSRDRLLTISLQARPGSLALYGACNRSKADYSLELDLFGGKRANPSLSLRRASVSSANSISRLCYHLFIQPPEASAYVNDMVIESVAYAAEKDFSNSEAFEFDINSMDLAEVEWWPQSKFGLVLIQPDVAHAPSYFRITKPPSVLTSDGDIHSLAQVLYKARARGNTDLERPLSLRTRVELAFKVAECGFYLLGTPWLASLSSKRLRRVKANGREPFLLEVQTLDLDDLYFEDPKALSESSQLFSIGLLLVEIALSDPDQSTSAKIQDPELRKSKILPLVERSMGSLYCKATAFCLRDRKSAPQYGEPEKYSNPEETGWTSYLTELLEDYHAQVYSRLEELFAIDASLDISHHGT